MPLAKTLDIDAYKPAEIARRSEETGVAKARLGLIETVTLGVLAGAFIAFGALFFLLVANLVPVTLGNVVGGCVFVGLAYRLCYRPGHGAE